MCNYYRYNYYRRVFFKKLLGAIIVVLGIFYNSKIDEKENNIAVQ